MGQMTRQLGNFLLSDTGLRAYLKKNLHPIETHAITWPLERAWCGASTLPEEMDYE